MLKHQYFYRIRIFGSPRLFSEVIIIPEIMPSPRGVNIYIDESGDLGFTGELSPYFIIAAIIAQGPEQVQKCRTCMKRTMRKLPKKYKNIAELKYHNTDDTYRRRILEDFSKTEIEIAYVVLRKEQVYDNLRNNGQILYNYLTGSLVANIISKYGFSHEINVIIDKSLDGVSREEFDKYLIYRSLDRDNSYHTGNYQLEVTHVDSKQNLCVQAVDFIAGAIHRHYREHVPMADHYHIIEGNITVVLDYFKGRQK